jgi:hypothetical protein
MSKANRVTKNVAINGQKKVLRISLSSFLITIEVIYKNTLNEREMIKGLSVAPSTTGD